MMEQEANAVESTEASAQQLLAVAQLRRRLADLMQVDEHQVVRPPDAVIVFRGRLLGDTESTYEEIVQRFADMDYTVWLRDRPDGRHEVIATKGLVSERRPGRAWVNGVLFVAALASVLYSGTFYTLSYNEMIGPIETGAELFRALVTLPLTHLHLGIPFAATLMGILLVHELSHYFVARRYGSPVSLPYFIPLPVPEGLGTMGAVIVQRAPMRSRKALFDIGIAGPLGGLIVAIPLLILGLSLSEVGTPADFDVPPGASVQREGDSLLYRGLKYVVKGEILPSAGEDVWQQRDIWLHPVAYAAWAGLLVTMINLVPVGQLDGGHVSYALLGRHAWTLGYILVGAMVAWGLWLSLNGNGGGWFWLLWSLMNLTINRRHPPPLDDATKLNRSRVVVGVLMLVLFILLFMPVPMQVISLPAAVQ